jgi:hypothetical protein
MWVGLRLWRLRRVIVLAILVAIRRFHGMGTSNSRLLRSCGYVRM